MCWQKLVWSNVLTTAAWCLCLLDLQLVFTGTVPQYSFFCCIFFFYIDFLLYFEVFWGKILYQCSSGVIPNISAIWILRGHIVQPAKHNLKLSLLLFSCLRCLIPQICCIWVSQMKYTDNCPEHLHWLDDDDRSKGVLITSQVMWLPMHMYVSDIPAPLCSWLHASFLSSLLLCCVWWKPLRNLVNLGNLSAYPETETVLFEVRRKT